ncbi:MAG: hypothetical protein RLY93_14870 [Sumerlaeia bacterium]
MEGYSDQRILADCDHFGFELASPPTPWLRAMASRTVRECQDALRVEATAQGCSPEVVEEEIGWEVLAQKNPNRSVLTQPPDWVENVCGRYFGSR